MAGISPIVRHALPVQAHISITGAHPPRHPDAPCRFNFSIVRQSHSFLLALGGDFRAHVKHLGHAPLIHKQRLFIPILRPPLSGGLDGLFFFMGTTMSETANPSQAPAEVPSRQRQPRSIQERANQRLLEEAKDLHGQALEDARSYAEGGCFYASSTPIANAIGAELGGGHSGQRIRSGATHRLRVLYPQ
jgi:hypothetical protein